MVLFPKRILAVVFTVMVFALPGASFAQSDQSEESDALELYRQLELFGQVFDRIRAEYV
jgi:hypothetical protein